MHFDPIPEASFDRALLDLLIEDRPGLWSIAELDRALTPSDRAGAAPSSETADAIERLHAAGLIHRIGGFVFASNAAHAAQRLAS